MARYPASSRREIVSRSVLGIAGSYAVAALAAMLIARFGPEAGGRGNPLAAMVGFALFGLCTVLAFSMASARTAWIVVGGMAVVLAAVAILAGGAR